mmetsp:Transcript_26997/g.63156  ORF Transcript_26997/g.63156 Transcript_26997/m.63156 type:complete len:232 (+) Transcript_26997:334-1029(+)|eukprot:CAMPEP_0182589994 /NCGR_PEP_ID=MMETSP1324-20130603/70684_1 /TAXON_ID=236786 /ORGANISM="Florenciella sp., Strain RCC1587" /LENGTH=231 /DNA_ID=CAMNT_0024807179 /DNA_START=293 /DNA_END=988 /DNA_ORIENTATION=+
MARYGEINNGSWMVNGEQNLDVCVVVCGDDMAEARRKVCAFGRGVKADDGQERLEGALFRRGRPGKVGQFVMWEFHEWPSETHDEDADRAAKMKFAAVSERANAAVVFALSREAAQAGYMTVRPNVSEDMPIVLVVGGDAAHRQDTLKWTHEHGIPRGDAASGKRPKVNASVDPAATRKARRRNSKRMKSVYQYAFCVEDTPDDRGGTSGMAAAGAALLDADHGDGKCVLM